MGSATDKKWVRDGAQTSASPGHRFRLVNRLEEEPEPVRSTFNIKIDERSFSKSEAMRKASRGARVEVELGVEKEKLPTETECRLVRYVAATAFLLGGIVGILGAARNSKR